MRNAEKTVTIAQRPRQAQPPRHRRRCPRLAFRVALGVGVTLALAGCANSTGPATPGATPGTAPAVVGLTYVPNIQFAPFYVADSGGLLPTGVSLRHHGAAEGLFTALAAGQEQFVVAGGDEILQARANGTDILAVSAYFQRYPVRVIVPQDSPIQTLADLKGHTVGLPGRFGESWFALVLALRSADLSETDVTIQEIGYTQQAALQTGKVDAVIGFANGDAVSFEQAGFPIRQIDPKVPLVPICLATTRAFADAHPETVRAVVTAVGQGIAQTVADPTAALDAAAAYIPDFAASRDTSAAVLAATVTLFTDQAGQVKPALDPGAWTAMAQAMAQAGLIPTSDTAASALTVEFT